MSMRRSIDDTATFYDAILIIMQIEERLGIIIADERVEEIRAWSDLSLHDLTTVVRSLSTDASVSVDEVVLSAVRAAFPNAPEAIDFAAPLLDAISPRRDYRGY